MSFKATEIMIGVLPAVRPFPGSPGFALCPEPSRNPEEDDVDCGEATRAPGGGVSASHEADLALLTQQLHQALSVQP